MPWRAIREVLNAALHNVVVRVLIGLLAALGVSQAPEVVGEALEPLVVEQHA